MKKIFAVIILSVIAISVANAETLTANLTLSSSIGAQCTPNVGKGLQPIVWNGVKDKRAVKSVGVLKKKDDETDINAAEPVEKLVEQGMKTMFEKCGYTLTDNSKANGIQVSASLDEFFAGAKKGIIMGETEAKGSMTLNMVKGSRSVDLQFGAVVKDKGLKKKNIKKLETALSDVLATMINNVVSTNQFAEAMKDLSK